MFGSCAIRTCEPRQVRKEAAISETSYVPQTSLLIPGGAAKGQSSIKSPVEGIHYMTTDKYIAIYRRFRPETFDKVLGQDHIIKVLASQIKDDSVGHAYLFCGTRGTGKTTIARLLAKGVNCLSETLRPCGICEHCREIKNGTFVDVIEIDAASNNGVDNIRELRESVKYPPSIGRKKVYIIDEVHMLSKGAFNALLKTLEEPPENVMFILATTEAGKLPATIMSRCLRFDFKRVPATEIMKGMKDICKEMSIDIDDESLALLASNADGSVRDGLSILEQCISAADGMINRDLILDVIGSPGDQLISSLTEHVMNSRTSEALVALDEMLSEGKDERRIMEDWIEYYRSVLMIRFITKPENILSRSLENIENIRKISENMTIEFINKSIYELSKVLNDSRWSSHPRILLEMYIIEMSQNRE